MVLLPATTEEFNKGMALLYSLLNSINLDSFVYCKVQVWPKQLRRSHSSEVNAATQYVPLSVVVATS